MISIRPILALAVLVATSASTPFCRDESVARCGLVDLSQNVSEFQLEYLEGLGYGPLDKMRACEIGSYYVYASDDSDTPFLFIRNRNKEENVAWIDEGGGISLFVQDQPFLLLDDKDEDGNVDWLDYEVQSADPGSSISVIDNNLDGQADSRFKRVAGEKTAAWLWFDGSWRPIQWLNAPEPNRILVDDVWRRYERVNGQLVLLEGE